MVSSVSPLSQALTLLRAELLDAGAARSNPQPAAPAVARSAAPTPPATALASLPAKLRALRAQQGRLIPAKALRLFVEAAMLDELNATMQLDPLFGSWVERTCQAIEQDPENHALIVEAIKELDELVD